MYNKIKLIDMYRFINVTKYSCVEDIAWWVLKPINRQN